MTPSGMATISASMEGARNYARWILHEFTPYVGTRVMEVGLARANYLPLSTQVEDYLGVDIDPDVVAWCAQRYPAADLLASDISAPEFVARIGARRFDTVLCVNVLEHIPDDSAAISHLLGVLRKDGRLLLFVPAFQFLYTDLDRLAGHVRRYTCARLVQALPRDQVVVEKLEYFNPLGALGWWAQRLVRHASLESAGVSRQVHVFDRYMVPVSRRVNRITKGWFGQSVICVARKL